jgi:CheY-like chemotaxis protein
MQRLNDGLSEHVAYYANMSDHEAAYHAHHSRRQALEGDSDGDFAAQERMAELFMDLAIASATHGDVPPALRRRPPVPPPPPAPVGLEPLVPRAPPPGTLPAPGADEDKGPGFMQRRKTTMSIAHRARARAEKGDELAEFLRHALDAPAGAAGPGGSAAGNGKSPRHQRETKARLAALRGGPLGPGAMAAAASAPVQPGWAAPGSGTRVLIVDDEPVARKRVELLIRRYIDAETIVPAKNGKEAVELVLAQAPFDLIVCDINMGGTSLRDPLNGPAASFRMRAIEKERSNGEARLEGRIPVIFLSATSRLSEMYQAFYAACGANAVVAKPADVNFGKLAASLLAEKLERDHADATAAARVGEAMAPRKHAGALPAVEYGAHLAADAKAMHADPKAKERGERAAERPPPVGRPAVVATVTDVRSLAILEAAYAQFGGVAPRGRELVLIVGKTGIAATDVRAWFETRRASEPEPDAAEVANGHGQLGPGAKQAAAAGSAAAAGGAGSAGGGGDDESTEAAREAAARDAAAAKAKAKLAETPTAAGGAPRGRKSASDEPASEQPWSMQFSVRSKPTRLLPADVAAATIDDDDDAEPHGRRSQRGSLALLRTTAAAAAAALATAADSQASMAGNKGVKFT